MIARIMGEGQVRLAEGDVARLNELDGRLLQAVEEGDEPAFRLILTELLDTVREVGEPLPDDALEPSELILPADGASLAEVRKMLSDDGLIPG